MSNQRIHFLTFLIGFSQIYAWATTYYLPAAIAQLVADQTGQSYLAIIGGFSWALLIGGLCAPKTGAWIDLEGGQRPLFMGSLLMGVGLLVLSQTNGLIIWYSGWTFIGIGMAFGLFNASFAAIGRLFGQKSKTIIVRVTLISGFATMFWPVTTHLIASLGWKKMVLLYSIPHLLIWAPLYYFGIPNTVPKEIDEPASSHLIVPEKVKIVFYLLAIYATIRSVIGTAISVNILDLLRGLGLTISAAAMVASVIGPSQIVGRLMEIYVGNKFDPLKSSIFWTALLPVSIFILILVGSPASSFFSIVYGMSNGVLTITMSVLPLVLFGSKGYAGLLGKLAFPVLIAQAATPLLIAPMMESWSSNEVFILAGAFACLSFLCLLFLFSFSRKNRVSFLLSSACGLANSAEKDVKKLLT